MDSIIIIYRTLYAVVLLLSFLVRNFPLVLLLFILFFLLGVNMNVTQGLTQPLAH